MPSQSAENYLKAIFKIEEQEGTPVSTNAIAKILKTSAASVTDMLKKLAEQDYLVYERYKGVQLSDSGKSVATALVRKHRLWEVFMVEKLNFNWDEVHEVAEQLEHIQSKKLIDHLDAFLEHPKFDPHGDPIPDAEGNIAYRQQVLLSEMKLGDKGVVVGVQQHSKPFLQFLERLKLTLGAEVEIIEWFDFDQSVKIRLNGKEELMVSQKVNEHVFLEV